MPRITASLSAINTSTVIIKMVNTIPWPEMFRGHLSRFFQERRNVEKGVEKVAPNLKKIFRYIGQHCWSNVWVPYLKQHITMLKNPWINLTILCQAIQNKTCTHPLDKHLLKVESWQFEVSILTHKLHNNTLFTHKSLDDKEIYLFRWRISGKVGRMLHKIKTKIFFFIRKTAKRF